MGAVRRLERDVDRPVLGAFGEHTEPEVRLAVVAEADGLAEVHDARGADRREKHVIERCARADCCTLNSEVIKHGAESSPACFATLRGRSS